MKRTAVLLVLLVAFGGGAACGGGEEASPTPETVEGTLPETQAAGPAGNAEAGADIYAAQGCGGCHTFQAAGSTGTIGPNLDQSSATMEQARAQIANGGGGMPAFKDKISEQEIADVAAYVVEQRGG